VWHVSVNSVLSLLALSSNQEGDCVDFFTLQFQVLALLSTHFHKKMYSKEMVSSTSSSANGRRSGAFVILTTTLVLVICISSAHGFVAGSRPLSKRSFFDIQCKGVYDKGIFARLDRICDDCYNLYREPQLHSLCRSNCFGSQYFKGCLDALLLNDDEAKYEEMVEILGKKWILEGVDAPH